MNALLAVLSLALAASISLVVTGGSSAVLFCIPIALAFGFMISKVDDQRSFLLQIFAGGLIVRILVGALIYQFKLQVFFGGDALTYDLFGNSLLDYWKGDLAEGVVAREWVNSGGGWGMLYLVAAIYRVVGRNMLAVQFFNAVIGAATAPVVFLCARHIFQNLRVARLTAFFVAFYPSLVLWSSQGLKDGPIIFLLAISMLATLRLAERFSVKHFALLVMALVSIISLRFYVFYMVAVAIGGSFLVGMGAKTSQSLSRKVLIVVGAGLALTYLGVLRGATVQLEAYGNLQAVQTARSDLATSNSGFAQDVDVSTTSGALSAIPVGLIYLLFAPFPWQLANLRQSITLPEMVVWWGSFPMLVLGIWFTVKYRLRQALPILIFTTMLTLAYSIFQGNVGTAYRQRAQILVFYFIFVAVGGVLLKERRETRRESILRARQASMAGPDEARAEEARRRTAEWPRARAREMEEIARGLSERIKS